MFMLVCLKWTYNKMLTVFVLLLMLRLARSTDSQTFETKTVGVREPVTLTCPRNTSIVTFNLFWIRIVSGALPEVLGGTYNFHYPHVQNKTPGITAKQEPGAFVLIISETQISDSGLYFCVKQEQLNMTLLKGTFLTVKGGDPGIPTIIRNFSGPGDSETLQCSLLSDSNTETCSGKPGLFWFRSGSDESYPTFIYTHGDTSEECEDSPEAGSPHKCVSSFSSSDPGTYYCAVASCGQILFGGGTKLDCEDTQDLKTTSPALLLLSAALALSLIFIAFLIYIIKTKSPNDAAAARAEQTRQQTDEDTLVYAAPAFSKKRAGKAERRNGAGAEGETTYSDIRTNQPINPRIHHF